METPCVFCKVDTDFLLLFGWDSGFKGWRDFKLTLIVEGTTKTRETMIHYVTVCPSWKINCAVSGLKIYHIESQMDNVLTSYIFFWFFLNSRVNAIIVLWNRTWPLPFRSFCSHLSSLHECTVCACLVASWNDHRFCGLIETWVLKMWRRLVWLMVTDVSEERTALIRIFFLNVGKLVTDHTSRHLGI
jgi:hypothetical protein